jgi:hypothetical protein
MADIENTTDILQAQVMNDSSSDVSSLSAISSCLTPLRGELLGLHGTHAQLQALIQRLESMDLSSAPSDATGPTPAEDYSDTTALTTPESFKVPTPIMLDSGCRTSEAPKQDES